MSTGSRLNVLVINGRFPLYSQKFVHHQIRAIKSTGLGRVDVFARSPTGFRFEESIPECAEGLLFTRPVNLTLLRRLASGVVRHPLRAARLLRLKLQGAIDTQTAWLAIQLQAQPDIVVTQFGSNFEMGVQLKRHVFPSAKNVVVFHGHDVSSYIVRRGWKPYAEASPFIDGAISVNARWAADLRANTNIADIRTVYLGTSLRPPQRRRNGDEAFALLFVGRFVDKKGFDDLYAAATSVQSGGKALRVHCVGDGPDFEDARARTVRDGQGDTFVFYGPQPSSVVHRLMSECDLLVAPSRTAQDGDCEGLPVVLMEAMAAGLPVLSTRHSGIPELITHNDTGLLVDERDRQGLAQAIVYAILNPSQLQRMAENARAVVAERHCEERQAAVFVAALREI